MGCNCKRKMEIEEKYGTPMSESLGEKIVRFAKRLFLFVFTVLASVIMVPIITIVAIYKLTISKNLEIVPPKFLRKYLA